MLTNQIIRSPAMAKATDASDDGGRSRESRGRVWVAKEFGDTWPGRGEAEYRNISVFRTRYIRALGYGAENFPAEVWPSRAHSAVGERGMGSGGG